MTAPAQCSLLAAVATAAALMMTPANATEIERVVSPGGIEAWLVNEPAIPLIAVQFAFRGGAAQDSEDLPGTADLVSSVLDQGAGDYDAQSFQEALRDRAIEMSFETGRDAFYGRMRTLTENRDEAFDLLGLAVNEPRFDEDALQRAVNRAEASLRRDAQDPRAVARRHWSETVFGDHPYGRPVEGTLDTVAAISVDDLADYHRRTFARDNLVIAVVGDIDAEALGPLLDAAFGALPEAAELTPVPEITLPVDDAEAVIEMAVPQTVIQFGRGGLKRHDEDFIPAFVVNHILGGGADSRLYEEVRETRGLAYSVFTYLHPLEQAGLFLGGVGTRNERAGESLAIVRDEIRRLAEEGPTEAELTRAKRYLIGSYALRFDSSGSIARQLVEIQLDELGIDYINIRNDLIEAVTIDDARRAAERLLGDGSLYVTLVGQPEGVEGPAGRGL